MLFEFNNLSAKEKELVFSIEDRYPECVARDIKASLDGSTVLQLFTPENITGIIAEIIKAIAVIAAARIAAKAKTKASSGKNKEEKPTMPPVNIVVIVLENGEKKSVLSSSDVECIQEVAQSMLPNDTCSSEGVADGHN